MPRLLVSHKELSAGLGVETKLWRFKPQEPGLVMDANEPIEMPIPAGTGGVNRRPCWATYNLLKRSRKYGSGAWSANILIDENGRCLRQGMPAPTIVPTVVSAGGPGVTAESVCYLQFWDEIGGRQGPLSAGSVNVSLSNQIRSWSALPTTCPDPSATHLRGLVANNGALPRVAWKRELGVTALTEKVENGALGEFVDDFTAMDLQRIQAVWHDRLWGAGNEQFPERAEGSVIQDLEMYQGLFLQTDGEPIVGMFGSNENFLFGSNRTIYRASGFTEDDITRDIEKPDIGFVGHHGIAKMHGFTIVPTTVGFYIYDGGFRYLMKDRATEWAREYKLHRDEYENAQGIFDPVEGVYKFGPVHHSDIVDGVDGDGEPFAPYVYWIIDAKRLVPDVATTSELSAVISNDARARSDAGSAVFYMPGSSQAQLVTGSCDGLLREENANGNGDDDGDLYAKKVTIEPATEAPDPGGAYAVDAVTWKRLWGFVRTKAAFQVRMMAGTEYVTQSAVPPVDTIEAPVLGDEEETPDLAELPSEGLTGAALCLRITVEGAITPDPTVDGEIEAAAFEYRGWGGTYGLGLRVSAGRPHQDGG